MKILKSKLTKTPKLIESDEQQRITRKEALKVSHSSPSGTSLWVDSGRALSVTRMCSLCWI